MVAREERIFLARVARLNRALAASALPLVDGVLNAEEITHLGDELIELGEEFRRLARRQVNIDGTSDVLGAEILSQPGEPRGVLS